jgi:hypothetical protein
LIVDIPSEADFLSRAISLLNLAWDVVMRVQLHHNEAMEEYQEHNSPDAPGGPTWSKEEITAQATRYWELSQPEMQNALAILSQATEMYLKGKIAGISPYLLIVRDPKEYPRKSDSRDVSFSDFRTIDATDLRKIVDTVCSDKLPTEFFSLCDTLRKDRNLSMHSAGSPKTLEIGMIIRQILMAHEYICKGQAWTTQRVQYRQNFYRDTAYDITSYDFSRSNCIQEVKAAISALLPADCIRFFQFRKKDRCFQCPECFYQSNKYEKIDQIHLAQLRSRSRTETKLYCCVCNTEIRVARRKCENVNCQGNVLSHHDGSWGLCLLCGRDNDPTDNVFKLLAEGPNVG